MRNEANPLLFQAGSGAAKRHLYQVQAQTGLLLACIYIICRTDRRIFNDRVRNLRHGMLVFPQGELYDLPSHERATSNQTCQLSFTSVLIAQSVSGPLLFFLLGWFWASALLFECCLGMFDPTVFCLFHLPRQPRHKRNQNQTLLGRQLQF